MESKCKEKIKAVLTGYSGRTALSGIALFVCAAAFVPAAGIFRTVPFFVAGGAVAYLLGLSVTASSFMSAIMTLCLYLACARGVAESVLFALAAWLLSLSGVCVARIASIVKKSENKSVKRRGAIYIAISLLIALVLSLVLCGNAVSFVLCDKENSDYLSERYDDDVQKRYTCYEALGGGYFTYVSLKDGEDAYGNDDSMYINVSEDDFNDDVRNYREEKLLSAAKLALSEIVAGATGGFNVVSSDISFDNGEILTADANALDYLDRINYVLSLDSLVSESEREGFADICASTMVEISEQGFDFANIVFCAGDAKKIMFCAAITPETAVSEVCYLVKPFEEAAVLEYGVTEREILDYWENK